MLNPMMSANLPPPSEKRGPVFLQAVWIGVAIATLSLIARCMARYKRKARLLLDDWLMILALVCLTLGIFT